MSKALDDVIAELTIQLKTAKEQSEWHQRRFKQFEEQACSLMETINELKEVNK